MVVSQVVYRVGILSARNGLVTISTQGVFETRVISRIRVETATLATFLNFFCLKKPFLELEIKFLNICKYFTHERARELGLTLPTVSSINKMASAGSDRA